MADAGLQGRLADFTLEEILQLIALQQKTGVLTVDASYPMILAFESGLLVGYRDVRRLGSDPLEGFLKAYGYFNAETWEHVDFVQRHSKLDLTEILVNEGIVDADELAALQMDAAQEDVFRGMQLRDGRYHFTPGRDGMAGLKGRVRFKVDGLLMEAVRRIDEISGLRERFFSNDLKLRLADPDADHADRNGTERRLLALLARPQTLGSLIGQARLAEFDTLSTLDGLVQDGIVAVQSTPRTREAVDANDPRDRRRDRMVRRAVFVSFVAVLAAAAAVAWQPWSNYREAEAAVSVVRYHAARDQARLEAAVQLFEQAHGRRPASIGALVDDGWIPEDRRAGLESRFELVPGNDRNWAVRPRTGAAR